MWSALPVLRNWTAASKVEGEQRFRASLSAASSSGANGLVAIGNGFFEIEMLWEDSGIWLSVYVAVANKVNPFLVARIWLV
jgi:hypothetical protein